MSALYEKMMESCHMIDKRTVTGPAGFEYVYTDGAAFRAAIVLDKSLQARVAEHDGVKQVYTVTAPVNIKLDFHDIFRRDSDGATFRVTNTTADSQVPAPASFKFVQCHAERWDIPT